MSATIGAIAAAWHYTFGDRNQASATAWTVGGSATPAARTARLAARPGRGTQQEASAVLFDLGLGQCIKIGYEHRP
jgi:hypothetical protein